MIEIPTWSTACPDWAERIVERRSLIPFDPLFPSEAEAALDIFRDLRIVDVLDRPTFGEVGRQWIFDLVAAIFGAYDARTGRRLIRNFFELISKKNGKSTEAAGIMLTALLRNWRHSGEYYILAPTKEIADNSFYPAQDMVNADPNLKALLHVQPGLRKITHLNTGAFLKVVAADNETVSGKKTIGLLVDELWLFGKQAKAASMLREIIGGLVSRPEGFVIYLSTQSDEPPKGVFAQKLEEFRDIRDGKVTDPGSLGVLYEFPEKMIKSAAYRDPKNFYITNPNLGLSVDPHWLIDQMAKEERAGKAELNGFLAKHLNVQIGMALRADGWAGAAVWERGYEKGITLETILERCEVITIGSDGGGLDDLWGIYVIGRERKTSKWLGWGHAYISPEGMERRKANETIYQEFIKDGDLTLVDSLPEDTYLVVELIQTIKDTGLLAAVGLDPANIGTLVDELAKIDISEDLKNLIGIRQGVAQMGGIKTIERKLVDGTFRHGGQPIMGWCAGNAIVQPTATGIRIARDESGYGKIDPLMALFDAAQLMSTNPDAAVSVYEERGIRVA